MRTNTHIFVNNAVDFFYYIEINLRKNQIIQIEIIETVVAVNNSLKFGKEFLNFSFVSVQTASVTTLDTLL